MERCQYCPDECPRKNESISNPCILGVGPYDAKLMIICENPGINEDEDDIPFGGRSGKLLDSILEECGISKNEVYITNAVKCFTTRVDYKPTKKEIKYCSAYLEEEIANINPNVILTLGATPLFAVLGKDKITKLKNNIFISDKYGIKVIPTYHPAYILRNPNEYNELKKGVELAIAEIESKNKCTKTAIPNKTIIVNEDNFDAVINKILELDEYAFDLETTSLNPLVAKIICISISCKEGIGIIIPFDLINNNPSYMESIKKLFASTALKIGQNIKYDIEVLLCNRISVKGPFFDTMIAHHLLDENSKHGLDDLVLRYLDLGDYWTIIEKDKERVSKELKISKDEVTYDLLNREMLYKYASKDADATFRLYNIFKEKLEKEDLLDFFYNHAMPYMPNIIEMEIRGVKVDREKLKELIDSYHIKLAEIKDTLYKDKDVIGYEALRKQREYKKLADKYEKSKILKSRYPNGVIEYIDSNLKDELWKFNFSSPKQLIELFFKYMKLTPVKFSEKGSESTDSEVLKILANANVTVAKLLMEYRKISKFLSTYLESVYKKSELDGRIHTTYLQTATVSGRLASINPNQQTLPRDAIDFKDCFVSDPGFLFVKSDLAQAEFRCWATYSNDTDMIRDIESGLDIHKRTASEVFNVLPENVTKEQRTAAKNCVAGDTWIPTDRGFRQIKELKVGDIVLDHCNRQEKIVEVIKREDDLLLVDTTSGSIKCTKDHPFYMYIPGRGPFACKLSEIHINDSIYSCFPLNNSVKNDYSKFDLISNDSIIKCTTSLQKKIINEYYNNEQYEYIESKDICDTICLILKSMNKIPVITCIEKNNTKYYNITGIHNFNMHKIYPVRVTNITPIGKATVYDYVCTGDKDLIGNGFYTLDCVFGLMYGRGAKAISKQYGISVEEAELVREKFFDRYPVASAWIEELQNDALNTGIVRSWFGRVRRVPKVFSNDDNEKLEALRQAVNSPIQAQASDMNNAFMIRVLKAARTYGIKCYPAMTTHDDNTYQVEENKVNEFIQIINNIVVTAFPDWKCKMEVEIKIGNRLGSCKKLE